MNTLGASLSFEQTKAGRLGELQAEAGRAVAHAFGAVSWSRLYFGNEFCERLVPSVGDVSRAYDVARARGLAFSLLTSYVSDRGIDRFRPLFRHLASVQDSRIEVVINDWGLLRLLRREQPGLRPVLGRLLNRMLRDPRIAGAFAVASGPDEALRALRQSSVTVPIVRRFLGGFGVTMVEFDNLIQGLEMDFRTLGLAASLYVPYGYVATGRVCMMGSLELARDRKFDVASPCRRECQRYTLRFKSGDSPFGSPDAELFERGNTWFYFQNRAMLAATARMVERLGISRIVYQAGLPM